VPRLDDNLSQCAECGRLFEYTPGKRLCSECGGTQAAARKPEKSAVAPIAKRTTNVPRPGGERPRPQPGQLRSAARHASDAEKLFYRLRALPRCVRCNMRPRNGNAEFCLACQIELRDHLGSASHELFPPLEYVAGGGAYATDVLLAYEEKRMRAPTNRINVVGGVMLKYGNKR